MHVLPDFTPSIHSFIVHPSHFCSLYTIPEKVIMAEVNGDVKSTNGLPESLTNGNSAHSHEHTHDHDQPQEEDPNGGGLFQIKVKLPHDPYSIALMVSSQEQVQDVRQSIIEQPGTFQYTCFHLEHNGQRINDFIELSEVKGLKADSEITLVEDPYTEKEARTHFVRIRELIAAAGDRVDLLQGISAGISLHDAIAQQSGANGNLEKTPDSQALDGFQLEAPPVLETVLPKKEEPLPKTVKLLSVSPWNPPPYSLRQKGHLMYLQVTTNESEQFQVTASVSGFFVNRSSSNKFDPFPRPAPKSCQAHSLLSLLSKLSPSFSSAFIALQEANNQKDLLTTFPFQNAIPASPWLVQWNPLSQHQADPTRSQEAYLIGGADNTETLRDWNEEFQTTRELPKDNVQDRVFRERLTSKLFADYNDAAARGAVLVARGEVAPLNPTEGRDAQIFVYNNIFFSFGADGVQTFSSEGGDEAARVAVGKDVMGVKVVNQLDIQGLYTPGTVVVDYLGKRIVGQSIVPGIFKQREPGEPQIDYGGVEGREVVAENQAFVEVFEKLSKALRVKKHSVWDKEGKLHELEGSVETKGLLGTDGRKYVLDLYRITPLDIVWSEEVASPAGVEHDSYPHRMAVLRLELIDSYWRLKMQAYVKEEVEKRRAAKKAEAETVKDQGSEEQQTEGDTEKKAGSIPENVEQERVDLSNFTLALNPDVCSGQVPQTDVEKEEYLKDEAEVRAVCDHLRSKVIPELVQDLYDGDVGFPMDGASLSQLLHKRGINVRYLGRVTKLAEDKGKRLKALVALAIQEMVARAFKHISNSYLRHLPTPFITSCYSHLLNCLLDSSSDAVPVAEIDEDLRELYPEGDFSFDKLNRDSLKSQVESQVRRRYRYTLPDGWLDSLKPLQTLREIALKQGLQLCARDYFSHKTQLTKEEAPTTNGTNHEDNKKKKKKVAVTEQTNGVHSDSKPSSIFTPDDVLNVVPVVKDAAPRSALAEEALEAGRISLAQNQKQLGQELILESLSLHEQIYGILHPEVAKMYHQLSMLYYQTDEKDAAVELARKAVIVTERTLGVDSADTILAYLNLSLFEHAVSNTSTALHYVRHALSLWKIIYGPSHPDSITTMNNAAVMLQHLKQYSASRHWFEASMHICEDLFGRQSVNTATILFQLAQALALDQDSKAAVSKMREAYNIFHTELGPNDRNTKEAESWLEQLTQNAVSIAKHAKDIQNRRLGRGNMRPWPRVTLGTRPQPGVGQSSAAAAAQGTSTSAVGSASTTGGGPHSLDNRSIEELLRFIEGGEAKESSSKKNSKNVAQNPRLRGARSGGSKA